MSETKKITGPAAVVWYAIVAVIIGFLLYLFTFYVLIGFFLTLPGWVNPTSEFTVLIIVSIAMLVMGFLAEGRAVRGLMVYSLIIFYIIFGLELMFHIF